MKIKSISGVSKAVVLPLSIALLLAAAPVAAKDAKVSGMGIQRCSTWTGWKIAKSGELRALTLEWSNGFIAGHNIYSAATNDSQSSVVVDAKVLTALLDSFCEKYPEQRILNGVADIVQSLGGAKINVAPKSSSTPGAPESLGQPRSLTPEQRKQKGTSL